MGNRQWKGDLMENFWQDIRYGVRMLLKSPGVSIVATIALALGIGANTAIFSVVNAVLLRPLPFASSEQLMTVWETDRQRGSNHSSVSYPNFADWQAQNHVFERMSSFHDADFMLTGRGDPARIKGAVVNADIFPLLGASPVIGRTFLPEEDQPGDQGRVVVLSQKFFQSRFNSDAGVLNQMIVLDGKPYTIVGVMPQTFQFPISNEPAELWTTVAEDGGDRDPITAQRGAHYMAVIGRLKPGVTREQAQAEMDTIAGRLEQQYPDSDAHRGARVIPALEDLIGDIRPALLIMLGAVACVLLIACANVANLLLARAMTRQREMAIRSALGASRWRVVRQLLTESILLSLTGGALGLLLAVWWSALLVSLDQKGLPRAVQVGLDARVLGFTFALSVLTGIVFGVVPALHASKSALAESLKDGRGSGEAARHNRVRGVLVVAELSIAVVLLIGAGLLIQSLWRLHRVDPGFNTQNVLAFDLSLPDIRYSTDKQNEFYRDLTKRIEALPGVRAASSVAPLPLSGNQFGVSFATEGRPVPKGDQPTADFYTMGLDYFKTMGIPLLQGRDFNDHDVHKAPGVVIVNQAFAQKFFPGENPLGKRIQPGISTYDDEPAGMREIIGVVGNVKQRSLSTEAKPAFYIPQAQTPFDSMTVVVKSNGDPHSVIGAVTNEVRSIDKDLPLFNVKTLDDYVADSVSTPRFNTTLLGIFAAVALVLTVVGLYGVMSYSVAQRTGEIGIRMALGAQTRDVLSLIVGQGVKLVLLGLAIGLIGAFALTRVVATLLFGVGTKDPITFAAVTMLLSVVALLACYIPARRATKVDPLVALRYE
jgi:putative ABC transport system permease protein